MTNTELKNVFGKTPQNEPIIGKEAKMAKNYAGGYSFKLDKWKVLDRFLILGTEEGTYYTTERKLTVKNAKNVMALIQEEGIKVVDRIIEVSSKGLAPKNNQALFCLAMCASFGNDKVKKYAFDNLNKVARIGTHLFLFVSYIRTMRGWGRGLKRAILNWYKNTKNLPLQVLKYRNREGWTHRDILRCIHAKPFDRTSEMLFEYLVNKTNRYISEDLKEPETKFGLDDSEKWDKDKEFFEDFLKVQNGKEKEIIDILKNNKISHEMIPNEFKSKAVWEALVKTDSLPITALIRNLPTLTKNDILVPLGKLNTQVVQKLTNKDILNKGRVHPLNILNALYTYQGGKSFKGQSEWSPVQQISSVLEKAFYLSFKNLPKINKRVYLAVDVSSSMEWNNLHGMPAINPMVGAMTLAMCFARQCDNYCIYGFTDELKELKITKDDTLSAIQQEISNLSFGRTDCAMPMLHALDKNIKADAFIVLTDNETWAGKIHPVEAIKRYRQKTGINAKLIVVGMTATDFTIANPEDQNMLDIVGFDSSAPKIIETFLNDSIERKQ